MPFYKQGPAFNLNHLCYSAVWLWYAQSVILLLFLSISWIFGLLSFITLGITENKTKLGERSVRDPDIEAITQGH